MFVAAIWGRALVLGRLRGGEALPSSDGGSVNRDDILEDLASAERCAISEVECVGVTVQQWVFVKNHKASRTVGRFQDTVFFLNLR